MTNRILFQTISVFVIIIALFVYTAYTSARQSLKNEIQERVNISSETFSLIFYDTLSKISFDVNTFSQTEKITNAANILSAQEPTVDLKSLAEYQNIKTILSQELVDRNLSFIDLIDETGKVLVSANSDGVGHKISMKGFVETALLKGASARSIEIMSRDELTAQGMEYVEAAKVGRIPTAGQKIGWREADYEEEAMMITAVSIVKNNNQKTGAIVAGIMLNNNNEIIDRVVEKSGGIATIYFYDARISTNQMMQSGNVRAIGSLAPEVAVNEVYIRQDKYIGEAFEIYENYLMAYEPIKNHDSEVIGSLARGIREADANNAIIDLKIKFIIFGLASVVTIYILIYFLVRGIIKPLKELAGNTYRIGRGNLDIDINPPQREDEIGDLTHSFIIMKEKLKEYYTKLEDLVAKRTKELRTKVKDLEKARHSIEEEKNKSESILQNVGDGVLALNQDKKFIACNNAASDLLEYDVDEIIGSNLEDIIKLKNIKLTGENKGFNPITEAMKQGKVFFTGVGEFAVVSKKKKQIPVSITATPLKDMQDGVHGGVVVIKDVTKEQEIDKMKSEFVSVASHQLRTPLSASKWFLEMLMDEEAGKINKEQAEYLDHTYRSNERMIALVNDLLNVSRIESGTIAIEPIDTDLAGMINSVIFELTPKIKEKRIKTVFEKPKAGLPVIKVDPKLIRQVFQNLLSNAVKYTKDKGTVGVRASQDKRYLRFEVFDTGVGIPKSQQPKVFKKFFRADNVITMQTEGTGLGLYVAKSVVDASGGKIWFKSEEGRGTSFFFTLPLAGSRRREGEKTLI